MKSLGFDAICFVFSLLLGYVFQTFWADCLVLRNYFALRFPKILSKPQYTVSEKKYNNAARGD